jgi:small-conductance mechanosensitive channel
VSWSTYLEKLDSILNRGPAYVSVLGKVILALAGAWLAWLVLRALLKQAQKKTADLPFFNNNPSLFMVIRRALLSTLMWVTGTYLIRVLTLTNLFEKIFHALFLLVLAKPVKDVLIIALEYLERHLVEKTATKVDDIIFELLNRFSGVIIYAVAVVLALDLLGINVMPFVAGAGVAGIAIGFAAKDTLSNLIAGVLLIIDRPFELGDRIEVWSAPRGSATWGDVIDIGLRATKIRTTDNLIIVIPNNEIMKRDIVNYTLMSSAIRVRINMGVAYDADIDAAKKVILGVAASAEWIAPDPPPVVVVRNFGESSVDLQLRVWIGDARKRMQTISYITDRVKAAFDTAGIEIPYPKRDITITQKHVRK